MLCNTAVFAFPCDLANSSITMSFDTPARISCSTHKEAASPDDLRLADFLNDCSHFSAC